MAIKRFSNPDGQSPIGTKVCDRLLRLQRFEHAGICSKHLHRNELPLPDLQMHAATESQLNDERCSCVAEGLGLPFTNISDVHKPCKH